jgi:hypothetical protein
LIVATLTHCPECAASLAPAGLEPQRCAECGFQYAADTVVFRPAQPWRIYAVFALALLSLPGLLSFLETVLARLQRPTPLQIALAGATVALLIWCGRRLRVLLEPNRYVAITPAGIQARTPRRAAMIAWHDIREVDRTGPTPSIRRFSDESPFALEWVFDPGDVDVFRAELQSACRRWTQQTIPWRDAEPVLDDA